LKEFKKLLFDHCQNYLAKRISNIREAINFAQDSANDETKNSSGDKYETGRAMAQLEIEKNTEQLTEALKQKKHLESVQINIHSDVIHPGSLAITSKELRCRVS
jgi:hypothetical protein